MKKQRILILGGGFAGVKCTQTLSRALSRDEAEIILFNAENHMVFTPLLADVIGASVNPLDVVVPACGLSAHAPSHGACVQQGGPAALASQCSAVVRMCLAAAVVALQQPRRAQPWRP